MNVSRSKMIEVVQKNLQSRINAKPRQGFAAWGDNNRLQTARALLKRLHNGINPSIAEVVAYFGKGARFVE